MNNVQRREYIPISASEVSLLDRLTNPNSQERRILNNHFPDAVQDSSRAALAHRILAMGIESLRELIQEQGYQTLAASYTVDELTERRGEARTRNARFAAARGKE